MSPHLVTSTAFSESPLPPFFSSLPLPFPFSSFPFPSLPLSSLPPLAPPPPASAPSSGCGGFRILRLPPSSTSGRSGYSPVAGSRPSTNQAFTLSWIVAN